MKTDNFLDTGFLERLSLDQSRYFVYGESVESVKPIRMLHEGTTDRHQYRRHR